MFLLFNILSAGRKTLCLFVLLLLSLFACNRQPPVSTLNPPQPLRIKQLRLEETKGLRYFFFHYQEGKLHQVDIRTDKSSYTRSVRYHYHCDTLMRISHHPIGHAERYQYRNGRLVQIHYYKKAQTRSLFYDSQNRIVREDIRFNKKHFLSIYYRYSVEGWIEVSHLDADDHLLKQYKVSMSRVRNVFQGLGTELNVLENTLGYAIGNHPFLPTRVCEIQRGKAPCPPFLYAFRFTINRYGYPLSISHHNKWLIQYLPLPDGCVNYR